MKQRRVAFLASTVVRTSSSCGKCELTLATGQAKGGGRARERERKTAWNVCCETIVIDKCSFFILPTNYDYLLTPFFFIFFISFLLPLKLVYDIFAIILEIPLRESTLDNKLLHAQTSSLLRLILWILILIPLPLHNYVKHAKVIHKSFANHPES